MAKKPTYCCSSCGEKRAAGAYKHDPSHQTCDDCSRWLEVALEQSYGQSNSKLVTGGATIVCVLSAT